MTHNSQGIVDPLDFAPVLERQKSDGIKVTFTISADVTGSKATLSSLELKNQVREARALLSDAGLDGAGINELLAPVDSLVEDSSYWRLQSRGLVVFAAPGFFTAVRVPIALEGSLTVGERFNLLAVAPVLASDRKLYVLALAQNSVRLFDSTRNVIEEMRLENVPASFDDVIDELPERDIDVRPGSAGTTGTPSFHGPDGDMDRQMVERFIHVVAQEIGTRLGAARSQQLVLAAVSEYLPVFKSSCPYPAVFDGVVAGNPERTLPDDLRSAAWQLVNAEEVAREASEADEARSRVHAGKGSFDLAEIAKASEEGRVDTLFLPRDSAQIAAEESRGLANRALIGTLGTSGVLRTLGELEGEGLATFRF